MKTKSFLNLILIPLVALSIAKNTSAQSPVSSGLTAHYCFDGNANDAIGTRHGTVYSATLIPDRNGNANSAYSFDGINDYIELPNNVWFSGDFTISGWIKVDTLKRYQRFFEFGNGVTNDNVVYSPTPFSSPSTWGNSDALVIHRNSCISPSSIYQYTSGVLFPLGSWVFVTVVQKGNVGEVWRNGINVSSFSNISAPPCSVLRTQCYFGKSTWSTDEYFKGAMDDIRIYNRALNALEIDTLFKINKTCQQLSNIQTNSSSTDFYLSQNAPNPSGHSTIVTYKLPIGSKNAEIQIADITGKIVANYPLVQKEGEVYILSSNLQSGLYFYSLNVDGKVLGRKKMIVQ